MPGRARSSRNERLRPRAIQAFSSRAGLQDDARWHPPTPSNYYYYYRGIFNIYVGRPGLAARKGTTRLYIFVAALAHVISTRCLSMYFCLRKSNVFDWQHLIMLLISGVKVCFLKPARATCGKSRCRPFLFKSQPTRCCTCIFVAACLIRWAHRYESMFFSCIFVVACRVPWQL